MKQARGQHQITWLDSGREPKEKPNPKFPKGRDIRLPIDPLMPRCKVELPYPAKRCGLYQIRCALCGFVMGVSTAGRSDDPKSVEIPCRAVLN